MFSETCRTSYTLWTLNVTNYSRTIEFFTGRCIVEATVGMSKINHHSFINISLIFLRNQNPKFMSTFEIIFSTIKAIKWVKKPKTWAFNEPERKLWLRSGPNKAKKHSFRMNNRSSFGLFNKFKSYNPYKYVSCKKCTTTLGPQVSMVLEKNWNKEKTNDIP